MKKQHWITLVACVMAVVAGIYRIVNAFGYQDILTVLFDISFGIGMMALPWVTAGKCKIGCKICAVCLLVDSIMGLAIQLMYTHYPLWILRFICYIAFSVLLIIQCFTSKRWVWIAYIPSVTLLGSLLVEIVVWMASGVYFVVAFTSFVCYIFESIVMILSTYLFASESITFSEVKKSMDGFILNNGSTGFDYLDEYKKNMKK